MADILNHCRFYIGKLSLFIMMVIDQVEGRQNRHADEQNQRLNEHDGFGPISKPRDKQKMKINIAEFCVAVVCFLMTACYRMINSQEVLTVSDVYVVASILFSIMFCEIIRRCCLFAEEYWHVTERYNGSWQDAFYECMSLNEPEVAVILVVCIGITVKAWVEGKIYLFPFGLYICASRCSTICTNLLSINQLSSVEVSDTNEAQARNVSVGLAWSYYFGYLKIILPVFPNTFRNARGADYRIGEEDICDKVGERNRKLYVIIPKDGYCYKSFADVDDRIRLVKDMPELKTTRGGVQQRSYKNNLYEINIEEEEPRYIVMEYASPLLIMYDMSQHAKAEFTEDDRGKQVMEFYKNLKTILDGDPECKGRSKLILTGPGVTEHDHNGRKLADIIRDHLD